MNGPNRLNIREPVGFWFFGYGSLMWDPPFSAAENHRAKIYGYHRSFCVSSETYRGTPDNPGLSLGLDIGGSCTGIAFRISETERSTAIREIEAREMDYNPIYICRLVKLHLTDRRVDGHTLVVNRAAQIFAGSLSFEETARRIATCHGDRGPNIDYLAKTVSHLDEMDIPERHLHLLLHRANAIRGTG